MATYRGTHGRGVIGDDSRNQGYEPYIKDLQRAIYDVVMVGEASEVLQELVGDEMRYDLVIASEVLEHFTTEDAEFFIDRCVTVGDVVIIVTPSQFFDQVSDETPRESPILLA